MKQQTGFSLIEILISVTIAGSLIASMQGLLGIALNAESSSRTKNHSFQQGRFAMQLMVKSVRMTRRLMIPLAENPNTGHSEHIRDVLAVTLDPTLDRDGDGWADANNDKDYLDVNNNGSRDTGEPERVDEDIHDDMTRDGKAGIIGIDDNGDGTVDNGAGKNDDDEDGSKKEDPINGIDDDGDGAIDEDTSHDADDNGKSGLAGVDDDLDGATDESGKDDDDEDGTNNEDWLDPVVYFLNGTNLIQRVPNIDPADGTDYQENIIIENVSLFQIERIPQGNGVTTLVDISLEITAPGGELSHFNTRVGIGSGL